MADYRFYCVNGAGQIELGDWFAADNDDEAIAKARQLRPDARKCEVWHKGRLVALLSPDGQIERFGP